MRSHLDCPPQQSVREKQETRSRRVALPCDGHLVFQSAGEMQIREQPRMIGTATANCRVPRGPDGARVAGRTGREPGRIERVPRLFGPVDVRLPATTVPGAVRGGCGSELSRCRLAGVVVCCAAGRAA